ncbi:hypothetical protein C2G38_2161561 [Gigaspora rosea]|uniref:Uncharacterized protein n=1 Tax=Gigaspora rosea TaxID=44941 RepID=A0A397VWR4_9GLOM|nr:hypothetical protein C2G38_2161561 [Gigaspora rosea]
MTIQEFFNKLVTQQITEETIINIDSLEVIDCVELSKSTNTVAVQASLNCSIVELTSNFGVNVHYHLKTDDSPTLPLQNCFTIMMQNAQRNQLYLPNSSYCKPNRKQLLQQDIIDWIGHNGVDGHSKFEERGYHIPQAFMEFFGCANPESTKKIKKILTQGQKTITAANHSSTVSVRSIEKSKSFKIHKQNTWINPANKTKYYELENKLLNLPPWKPIDIEEFLPMDPILQIHALRYHTRGMRINYLRCCHMLLPNVKPGTLRTIYRMLTGDVSAAESIDEAKINSRIKFALDLGDPGVTLDMCKHNTKRPSKYNEFWETATQYLAGKAAEL